MINRFEVDGAIEYQEEELHSLEELNDEQIDYLCGDLRPDQTVWMDPTPITDDVMGRITHWYETGEPNRTEVVERVNPEDGTFEKVEELVTPCVSYRARVLLDGDSVRIKKLYKIYGAVY